VELKPVNFLYKVSFGQNLLPQTSKNMSVPEQRPQIKSLNAVTPDYNVQVPLKYESLGQVQLSKSTVANLYKMENGQKVVIIPKEGSTFVKTYVNNGSMNEPDKMRGISHFIEHNLFNGSGGNNGDKGLQPGEFFKTVDKMGAETNASTGFSQTDYYVSTNLLKNTDLAKTIKIHAEMLENPLFTVNMIEKEKGPVTSEISMILDNPNNLATNTTLKNLYGIKSTSTDVIGGTVENINKLTRDDVVNYYKQNYYPSDMVTVVTGEVNPEETMKLISKEFQSQKAPTQGRKFEKLNPIQKTVRNDIISDKANSAIVSIGFNGPANNNTKDKILLDAIQYLLLGSSVSRLDKPLELVNSNALVSTERISNKPSDGRVVLLETETTDDRTEKVLKTIFAGITDLAKNPPSNEDMSIIKKDLKLYAAKMFEDPEAVNSAVGQAMLDNDLDSVSKFDEVVDSMTAKDVSDFAKKYLNLNKAAITVVHPATADTNSINKNYQNAVKSKVAFTGNIKNSEDVNVKTALDEKDIKTSKLPNNIELGTYNTNNELAALELDFKTYAPAKVKPGTAEILSQMFNCGSAQKDEKSFFKNLEKQGISTEFYVTDKGMYASSNFLPADADNAIKSIKEVFLTPRMTAENFKNAKDNLKADLANSSKSAHEALMKEAFEGTRYGVTNEDLLKNIDNITLEDVKGLYSYIMQNAQGTAAVAGPLEKNPEITNTIATGLSSDFQNMKYPDTRAFNIYKPISQPKVTVQEDNKSQAEIEMGYKFPISGNIKDETALKLMNIILGGTPSSRLFSDLREKQKLAYQVCSRLSLNDDTGLLSMYIKTTTDDENSGVVKYDNLQKSIEGFKKHAQKFLNEDITDEELENAKLHLKDKLLKETQLTDGKEAAVSTGFSSPYGVTYYNQALEMIDNITKDDIKSCAKYIFNTNPVTSIVATKNTLDNNKQYIDSLGQKA
jgi:predicted Zn-dependent peptidase